MSERDCYQTDRCPVAFVKMALGVVAIGAIVFLILPLFTPQHDGHQMPQCQCNMNQIGKSIKTYLSDWDETYPTNRRFLPNGQLGPISSSVPLGKPGINPDTGKPYRSTAGICWVEAMHPYIEPIAKQDSPENVWKCDKIGGYSAASNTAAISYVFNRNLLEKPETVVRYASNLMLLREADRLLDSDVRPVNDSCTKDQPPVSAFLASTDRSLGLTNPALHGNGSNIIFADGHVKVFPKSAFPRKCKWDPKTKTWGNADGSIMVSP